MARNEFPARKRKSIGQVIKVQKIIDFIVLAELLNGRRMYANELEQSIIAVFKGDGVSNAYLTTRLQKLAENEHLIREWETDNRYNRYYQITDRGITYFKELLQEVPAELEHAMTVYKMFSTYIGKFDKMNLS